METCENCEITGEGAASWAGICHDCDNQMEAQLMEEDNLMETMPMVNVCECGSKITLWIECDDCWGYDEHPHHFLACANCYATSVPFTEMGEPN